MPLQCGMCPLFNCPLVRYRAASSIFTNGSLQDGLAGVVRFSSHREAVQPELGNANTDVKAQHPANAAQLYWLPHLSW
jgi:hypothetical protein